MNRLEAEEIILRLVLSDETGEKACQCEGLFLPTPQCARILKAAQAENRANNGISKESLSNIAVAANVDLNGQIYPLLYGRFDFVLPRFEEALGVLRQAARVQAVDSVIARFRESEQSPVQIRELAEQLRQLSDDGQRRGFEVWSPAQFLEYQPPEGSVLLGDGFLERGEMTSLVGVGGLGKTRLATRLCIAQILGESWCGLPTHGDPQKCLFLSNENGLRRWKTDLSAMMKSMTAEQREVVGTYLRILALAGGESGDLNLGDPAVVTRFGDTVSREKPGILVLDPLAALIAGDENSAKDLGATLQVVTATTRRFAPEAAVLLIHHARSGAGNVAQAGDGFSAGNFARGSKALFSRVRCELQLAPADKDDPSRLVLACGKSNNAPRFETRGLVFDSETFNYRVDESFDVDAWRDDVAGKRREQVIAVSDVVSAVSERYAPGRDVPTGDVVDALKAEFGVNPRTVQRRIQEAIKAGYLRNGLKRSMLRLGAKPMKP